MLPEFDRLFQLNFRDMAPWDHDEANESTAHVDFDGGCFGFGFVPRLGLLCSGFLDGRGSWEAVLE